MAPTFAPLSIARVAMTQPHYLPGRSAAVRLIVLHATAGHYPGDYGWLRAGGSIERPISCHYYIDKAGVVTQFVTDDDTAWHAGSSSWLVDGKRVNGCNSVSLGIELENDNSGRDPYPAPQVAAARALTRQLVARYRIPPAQLVRHLDISPGRKTDPAGFPWLAFVAAVYTIAPLPTPPRIAPLRYSEHTRLLSGAPTRGTAAQCCASILARPHGEYRDADIRETIVPAYFAQCAPLGLDPVLAIAQMIHETGNLTSFWSARPQRNPAGIGVNGQRQEERPANVHGWAFNTQRAMWERGLSFASWTDESIPAQLGRLLAWALPPGAGTEAQRSAIRVALSYRPLADKHRGTAPTLKLLGKAHNPSGEGWASPGTQYGARIAAVANALAAQ